MPVKSTSENPDTKFWSSPGPNVLNNTRQVLILFLYAGLSCASLLLLYAWREGNPVNRMGFAIVMSALPALVALAFLRLTKLLVSWQGAATLYLLIFFLVLIIQHFGRMISIYN